MKSHFLTESQIDQTQIKAYDKVLGKMNKQVEEYNEKLETMIESLDKIEIEKGISYLDGKNLLLSIYLKLLTEFIQNKVNGNRNEELIKNLLYIKLVLEKSKVIDMKLNNKLEKHQRIANGEADVNTYKSNILNLNEEPEKIVTKSKFMSEEASKEKYKASNMYFDFTETTNEKKERKKNILKDKEKIKNSEFYKDMLEEIDDRPEEYKGEIDTHLGRYMNEVEKYEEDMLSKVYVSKKTVKDLKKKDRKEEDLNNFTSELKYLDSVFSNNNNEERDSNMKDHALSKFKKQIKTEKKKLANEIEKENSKGKKQYLNRKKRN